MVLWQIADVSVERSNDESLCRRILAGVSDGYVRVDDGDVVVEAVGVGQKTSGLEQVLRAVLGQVDLWIRKPIVVDIVDRFAGFHVRG